MLVPESLRLLHLIGTHGSLSAAADELGVTPAAVSQQVARLERELDLSLVVRGPRGARLTPPGAELARHGQRVDEEVHRASAALEGLRGRSRARLRIGAIHAAALHLLPPALTALHHRHPAAEVSVADLLSVDALPAVEQDRVDVAVMALWDEQPDWPPWVASRSQRISGNERLKPSATCLRKPSPSRPLTGVSVQTMKLFCLMYSM